MTQIPTKDFQAAEVVLAYHFGRVEVWAESKCSTGTLTSAECKRAKLVAEQLRAIYTDLKSKATMNQPVDLSPYLRTLEALLPLLLAL